MKDYANASSDDKYNYVDNDDDDDAVVKDDLNDLGHVVEYEAVDYAFVSLSVSEPIIKVITRESLLAAQREDLAKVMEVLSLKEQHARTLLIHYRWTVEKILDILVERGKEDLFTKAGVPIMENDDLVMPELPSIVMCVVCMEDVPADQITAMDCGHYFCNTCWSEHFIVKIYEGQSRRIRCMAPQCNAICDETKVRILVGARDRTLVEKFDRFLLESFIEDSEKVKWCPSVPHCGNAIYIQSDGLCEVECTCGLAFCFGCLSAPHSPCSCQMWELWTKKCRESSETKNCITVITMPCPKCHVLVEKAGGCNMVVCVCGQPFCWLCGKATSLSHTYTELHRCDLFSEGNLTTEEIGMKEMRRHLLYNARYTVLRNSFRLDSKLKETIKERISKLEEKKSILGDFSWLTDALNRLFTSRRILLRTYPFAYCVFGEFLEQTSDNKTALDEFMFKDLQRQLESGIERLSMNLAKPLETYPVDVVERFRMEIIRRSEALDKICKRLYNCIENDILGSIRLAPRPRIASYKPNGVDKASEFVLLNSNNAEF